MDSNGWLLTHENNQGWHDAYDQVVHVLAYVEEELPTHTERVRVAVSIPDVLRLWLAYAAWTHGSRSRIRIAIHG